MLSKKGLKVVLLLGVISGGMIGTAAVAGDNNPYPSRYSSINRASEAGRYVTGRIGRSVGNEMCGSICGRGMEIATHQVYDSSRNAANRYSAPLQNFGRSLRRGR